MTIATPELDAYTRSVSDLQWLGRISWYSASDMNVRHSLLVSLLGAEGLEGWAPRAPAAVDIYRRVATASQRKRLPTPDPDVLCNILVRDVSAEKDSVCKRVVVEEVNSTGRRLTYTETHDVLFDRTTDTLSVNRLLPDPSPGDDVAAEIQRAYASSVGCVSGSAVRDTLRRVLGGHLSVSVRESGGVWFTGRDHVDVIDRLQRFADKMDGLDFHSLPLVDDPRQRDMVRKAAEDESVTQIDTIIQTIQGLLADGTEVSAERYSSLANQYRGLTERASAYAELLEDNLTGTQGRLELLSRGMRALGNRIKAD